MDRHTAEVLLLDENEEIDRSKYLRLVGNWEEDISLSGEWLPACDLVTRDLLLIHDSGTWLDMENLLIKRGIPENP